MTRWPTDSLSGEWLLHLTDWQTRYQTSWWKLDNNRQNIAKPNVSRVLCLRRSSTCLIPTKIFVYLSHRYGIIVSLETKLIILMTEKLTASLTYYLSEVTEWLTLTGQLTFRMIDWNRNLFELCLWKTRESCDKFPLNHGYEISIISNGNRTEWINKIKRPWRGSPIF